MQDPIDPVPAASGPVAAAGRRSLVPLVGQLVWIAIAIGLRWTASVLPPALIVYPASLALTLHWAWMIASWWWVTGSFFDLYALFVEGTALFHGAAALADTLFLVPLGELWQNTPPAHRLDALTLVLAAMVSLHLAALLVAAWRYRAGGSPAPAVPFDRRAFAIVGTLLMAASLPFVALDLAIALKMMRSGSTYIDIYEHVVGYRMVFPWARPLRNLFVPAILLLLTAGSDRRAVRVSLGGLAGLVGMLRFVTGTRQPAVFLLAAVGWYWDRRIRRIPRTVLLMLGFALFFVVLPLVSRARMLRGTDRLSASKWVEAYRTLASPTVSLLSYAEGTMHTIEVTVGLIPSVAPYENGRGYLVALRSALPVQAAPSGSDNLMVWIAWMTVPGWMYTRGLGLGSSYIAEAYANFGWIGLPLICGLIGAGLAWLELASREPARVGLTVFAGCLLPSLLYWIRAELGFVVRPFVWYSLAPVLMVEAVSRWRTRAVAAPR